MKTVYDILFCYNIRVIELASIITILIWNINNEYMLLTNIDYLVTCYANEICLLKVMSRN